MTISRIAARSSKPSFFANSSSSAGTTARFSACAVTSKLAALPATVGTPYSAGKVTSIVRVSPGFMPSSCSLKPGMKPGPADFDLDPLAGAAGEFGPVDPSDVVDRQHLALRRAAIAQLLRRDRLERAVALGDVRQRLVHPLRRGLDLHPGQLDRAEVGQRDLRQQLELDLELQVLSRAAARIEAHDVDLGLQRRAQATLGQHLLGGLGDRFLQHLGVDRRAEALAHHRRRDLARPEPGSFSVLPRLASLAARLVSMSAAGTTTV